MRAVSPDWMMTRDLGMTYYRTVIPVGACRRFLCKRMHARIRSCGRFYDDQTCDAECARLGWRAGTSGARPSIHRRWARAFDFIIFAALLISFLLYGRQASKMARNGQTAGIGVRRCRRSRGTRVANAERTTFD